jgi:hypothetical protein
VRKLSNPLDHCLVDSEILAYSIRDREKRFCSIMYPSLDIKGFTLIYLHVCTENLDKAIVGIVKLDAEFLISLFKMCDFVVYVADLDVSEA